MGWTAKKAGQHGSCVLGYRENSRRKMGLRVMDGIDGRMMELYKKFFLGKSLGTVLSKEDLK